MKLARRDILTFILSILGGVALAMGLQYFRPVGESVSQTAMVEDIVADRDAPRVGPREAPLTIVVFSDYNCPICRRSYRAMRAALAGRTDVQVIHKEWPALGPDSERAARIVLAAADQGIYETLHDRLMRLGSRTSDDTLREAVTAAGGDWNRVQNDLIRRSDSIDGQLARNAREAFGLGLSGVPAYLIGATLVRGGLDEKGFRKALRTAEAD